MGRNLKTLTNEAHTLAPSNLIILSYFGIHLAWVWDLSVESVFDVGKVAAPSLGYSHPLAIPNIISWAFKLLVKRVTLRD